MGMLSRHWRLVPGRRIWKLCDWQRQRRRGMMTGGLSLCYGPTEPPLFKGTIPQHFASIVSQHGDRPAVIARSPISSHATEKLLTYTSLDVASNRLASSLSSLGVQRGHRVAVSLGNCAEFATLTYALFKLGAVLVPLNPTFGAGQVESALRHLGAEVLIIAAVTDLAYKPGNGRSNEELLRYIVGGDLENQRIQSENLPCLKTVIVLDNLVDHPGVKFDLGRAKALTPYTMLLEGSDRPVQPDEPLLPSDTINIQYTSGTTSTPKAAMLSHTSILNNGALIAHRMGLDPSDRIVVPPPLFHCFGSVLGYMATATTGAAILFPSPAFDPLASVKMCSDHEATGLYGVSTMFVAYLEALRDSSSSSSNSSSMEKPRHLKKGIVAGSSVPESLMRFIFENLGLQDLVICYGMTETSPVSCMTRPSDPLSSRCSSVGTPMPHTAVKIVCPQDRNKILPLHHRGELATAGYLVMKGYFNDAVNTAESLVPDAQDEDGGKEGMTWMYSGDEAEMDEQGFVRITGRIKDLIIRGGENISPIEVENCLFRNPAVQEASIVGVPDERLGEAVAAFIIPRSGWTTQDDDDNNNNNNSNSNNNTQEEAEVCKPKEKILSREDIRAWVRENLSSHLVPKYIFWTTEYPKTASGKVQKFKLREMAMTMLEKGL